MDAKDIDDLRTAIAALESQRETLGDTVLELATAPLRARLAALERPAGLKHRLVTVLFADVVGSTAIANGMDAEDTLGLLSAALRRMAAIVEAHQGRVLRFTGDGLKAAFGMDQTREDDAERAVRAGLAILAAGREQAEAAAQQHGITDFAVRVGVHSGDVALGAGVEDDNTAMGAAVHIAARMEQHAPPGGLRISHDTWAQVRGLFELEAQPPLMVKGINEPMQTYLVRGALDRNVANVARGLQGLTTPMVGRDAELQRLLDTPLRARETGHLQALTLIGDAGLGKSRLLRELLAALTALTAQAAQTTSATQATPHINLLVITARSQPDGLLRSWGLLRSVLAAQCGVADTDSADVARQKVVQALAPAWAADAGHGEHGAPAAHGERQAQLIGHLSGLDFGDSPHIRGLDPRSLRDQAYAAFRAYLRAVAAPAHTTLLLVEDLHWADDGSLDLLQHLISHAAELPLALVMSSRPALLTRRPDWGESANLLTLAPLAAAHSDELAQALLQRVDALPAKLLELIVTRAEGNPYYMEELVRRLIDDGVIRTDGPRWTVQAAQLNSLRLPTTLVGLLQARLDALPAAARHAARQASIIGHVFWDDALHTLDSDAPQALPALQQTAYVFQHERSDVEGTPERQFDHHLLHQVTYDTLLKAERKLGHGAAARWLAERTQGRGAEFLAMTGEHAERAGETALAIDCFEQAGNEARNRFANAAALSWLGRAVTLLGETDPGRRFDLLQHQEAICELVTDRSAQDVCHAAMASLLDCHPNDARLARLLVCRALLAERRGDSPASQGLAKQAIEVAKRSAAVKAAADAHLLLAWQYGKRGDHAAARIEAEQSLSWARQIEAGVVRDSTEAASMLMTAKVAAYFDETDQEREILHEVLSRAEARGTWVTQADALAGLIDLERALGHFEQMAALSQRVLTLARSMGSVWRVASSLLLLGEAAEFLGDQAAAMGWYEQCLPLCRVTGDRRKEALALLGLGKACLCSGDAAAAYQWHCQAQPIFEQVDEPNWAAENVAHTALCQIQLGHFDAARASVNQVLDCLQSQLVGYAADNLIDLRWTSQQVLEALGDPRAGPLLEQLHVDVHTLATAFTDAADRDRLIQAIPNFRDIVAAYQRRGVPAGSG